MKWLVYITAALAAYLVSGLNPAIILSRLIYKKDIREEGSGNPGFTNFMRVFGKKYAWWVFVLDILKSVVLSVVFGIAFPAAGAGSRVFGVAYTAVFALLGHAFPVWYGFRGGKGFLVNLASAFFLDWRAGLIALAVMVLLLLTTKYMSLATMAGLVLGAVSLIFFRTETVPLILYAACVLFTVVRHHENIVRLIKGTEAKFSFGGGKKSEAA